jgi:hypothetical protein
VYERHTVVVYFVAIPDRKALPILSHNLIVVRDVSSKLNTAG